MPLIINNTAINNVVCNGVAVTRVICNGVEVWTSCPYTPNQVIAQFGYNGAMQSYQVLADGLYLLEAWGARGGNVRHYEGWIRSGGFGGYSSRYVQLNKGTVLYVGIGGVGGDGNNDTQSAVGGYNGGGNAIGFTAGGGGATHIGTRNGTLAQYGNTSGLYIVAGGGGGAAGEGSYNRELFFNGGSGGGINGGDGEYNYDGYRGVGATQSGTGRPGKGGFGQGAHGEAGTELVSGGGGGLYGGGPGLYYCGGGGGSGFISVPNIVYGGTTYTNSTSNGVQNDNGWAKITFVRQ